MRIKDPMSGGTALLLAAHGDRGGTGQNQALATHCNNLTGSGRFETVVSGVLKGEPDLERALANLKNSRAVRLLVYPLFMAEGYFTKKVLPERLSAAGVVLPIHWARALGADEALPQITVDRSDAAARKTGILPEKSRLLIVGHGSKLGPASADATKLFATKVKRLSSFQSIETAFLEENVFLDDALRSTHVPTVVEGFFSGDGMHAGDDVPGAIAAAGANAVYTGALGADPLLTELVMNAARKLEERAVR